MDIDRGLYHCFHCGVSGYVPSDEDRAAREEMQRKREEKLRNRPKKGGYVRPKSFPAEFLVKNCVSQPSAQPLIEYLTTTRCLDIDLMQRCRITLPYAGFEKQQRCIGFNFFDQGEYINVKCRTIDKRFSFLPKAELIPWNIDSIIGKPLCYITEGEFDALSLIQCG